MFDAIIEKPKHRRWQTAVIIGSAVIHAAAIAGVVVGAMWQVDKLELTSNVDVTMRVPPPPGESSPPPAQKLAVQSEKTEPVKVKPPVPVQPTVVKDPVPVVPTGGGDPTATGTGTGTGTGTDPTATGSGDCPLGGCVGEDESKPECEDGLDNDDDKLVDDKDPACKAGELTEGKDPVAAPPIVPPGIAKGLRLSGTEQIFPPEMVRVDMLHQGKDMVQATIQVCVSAGGTVDSVRLLKRTGFPAYDEVLTREIREWKYKPYVIGGKKSPMCTVAVIIYRMKK
ncbi:MAG TPA: energy transducer TonB [Kofleriaceae bacterium]|nr:energy transducer TonB [Kofleriaceae bacterium]